VLSGWNRFDPRLACLRTQTKEAVARRTDSHTFRTGTGTARAIFVRTVPPSFGVHAILLKPCSGTFRSVGQSDLSTKQEQSSLFYSPGRGRVRIPKPASGKLDVRFCACGRQAFPDPANLRIARYLDSIGRFVGVALCADAQRLHGLLTMLGCPYLGAAH